MGLITRIKGVFGGGDEETMAYECQSCGDRFPTPHTTCPTCGSPRIDETE